MRAPQFVDNVMERKEWRRHAPPLLSHFSRLAQSTPAIQASMSKIWKTGPTKAFKFIKPIVHVGFVPLIIYIAIKQEPQLTYVSSRFCVARRPPIGRHEMEYGRLPSFLI